MPFLPTDLLSFIWGAAVGAIILLLTGFLQKAGEHCFELLKQKVTKQASPPPDITAHDRNLFSEFKNLFSNTGLIKYYKEHDFLLPFPLQHITPLYKVVEHWNDEAHNFTNSTLQKAKIDFVTAAHELAYVISQYTVPTGDGSVSVVTRDIDPENIPPNIKNEAKNINEKLPSFITFHEKLISLGNSLC